MHWIWLKTLNNQKSKSVGRWKHDIHNSSEFHLRQEAHGPHRSPEQPVQINEYIRAKLWLHIIKLAQKFRRRRFKFHECTFAILLLISPYVKRFCLFFLNKQILFTPGCFLPSLVEIGPLVLEKVILNFINVFSLFCNYLPLEKGRALHLNKLESPSPRDTLC